MMNIVIRLMYMLYCYTVLVRLSTAVIIGKHLELHLSLVEGEVRAYNKCNLYLTCNIIYVLAEKD